MAVGAGQLDQPRSARSGCAAAVTGRYGSIRSASKLVVGGEATRRSPGRRRWPRAAGRRGRRPGASGGDIHAGRRAAGPSRPGSSPAAGTPSRTGPLRVVGDDARHLARARRRRRRQPVVLDRVSRRRCVPFVGDLQLGQSTLDAQSCGRAGRPSTGPMRHRRSEGSRFARCPSRRSPSLAQEVEHSRVRVHGGHRGQLPPASGSGLNGRLASSRCGSAGCTWPVARESARDPILICPAPVPTARSARKIVLGLAGAGRHHRRVAGVPRHARRRRACR